MSYASSPRVEGLPPINEADKRQQLPVVRSSEKKTTDCQLTLRAFAWQESKLRSRLLFYGIGDMFTQSLILALVYLPRIRAPPCSHSQPGEAGSQKGSSERSGHPL